MRASRSKFLFKNILTSYGYTLFSLQYADLYTFLNMSEKQWFSPREIVTRLTIDYKHDYKAVVGTYIEASIDANITKQ